MQLDHSNATAIIAVTGLALSCYNKTDSNWEVGFIQADTHKLEITVTTIPATGTPTEFGFRVEANHKIFVECTDPVTSKDPVQKLMKTWKREAISGLELEDIRWVVDFDDELNKGKKVELKKPTHPVIEMRVSNPFFIYADPNRFEFDNEARLVRKNSTEARRFPMFSEGAKADINCKDGGQIVLRVDGPFGFSLPLKKIPGTRYEILMDNTCPPVPGTGPYKPSDFPKYYSVIKADVEYDIQVPRDGHGEGAVCNKGFLSLTPNLFPLPQ